MDRFKILKLGYYLFSITGWVFLCLFIITAYYGDGKILLDFNSIGEQLIETIFIVIVLAFIVLYGFLDYRKIN
ncbi:MAG: hypothetical protein KAW51_02060 [Candidatus Lokiarchaeota archaeon]|nr:hypothetical protein [Candidatus Lokiarchaeota archaeon]